MATANPSVVGGSGGSTGGQASGAPQSVATLTTDEKLDQLAAAVSSLTTGFAQQTQSTDLRFQQAADELRQASGAISMAQAQAQQAAEQQRQQAAQAQNAQASWAAAAQQAGQAPVVLTQAGPSSVKPPHPPKFRGAYKEPRVLEWTHMAGQYHISAGLADQVQGVFHISAFLADEAATWWRLYCQRMERSEVPHILYWWALRTLILEQFSETNRLTTLRDRFVTVHQTTTVAKYIAGFQQIVLELPEKAEADQVHQFLRGLKKQVQLHTRTHHPASLAQAMRIADEADRAIFDVGRPTSSYAGPRGRGPEPMQMNAATLSHEQRTRCIDGGLCFNCMKPGHSARFCPSKGSGKGKGKKTSGRRGKGSRPAAGN